MAVGEAPEVAEGVRVLLFLQAWLALPVVVRPSMSVSAGSGRAFCATEGDNSWLGVYSATAARQLILLSRATPPSSHHQALLLSGLPLSILLSIPLCLMIYYWVVVCNPLCRVCTVLRTTPYWQMSDYQRQR